MRDTKGEDIRKASHVVEGQPDVDQTITNGGNTYQDSERDGAIKSAGNMAKAADPTDIKEHKQDEPS